MARYRVYPTHDAAERESVALWLEYCADRGVDPADIEAGASSLDSTQAGESVLPPVTTGVATTQGRGIAPVLVPTRGAGGALLHKAEHERFDGRARDVGGVLVTLMTAPSRSTDRAELPRPYMERLDQMDGAP